MSTRTTFIALVDAFLDETGMSAYHFGVEAVRNHRFVSILKTGGNTTLRSIERAEQFIARTRRDIAHRARLS